MPFSTEETAQLLALKGVGKTVILRLEEAGFTSLKSLATHEASEITHLVGQMIGSRCWQNSALAKKTIGAIIQLAKNHAPC